jgi:methylmalonyl-CoA/ethylmalonyl-CoA epimerase
VVDSEGVKTVFFQVGDSKIELLEATHEQSAIAKFISKRGEGLHHVAFAVDHIESEMERLKSEGYTLINESPKEGADQKLICFIHPKSTGGILIELCQDRP